MKPRLKMLALLGVGALCAPVFAAVQAHPGTVNYVEGAAYLGGVQLQTKDIGSATVDPGQVLSTTSGKAEMLLTPGVFFRLDDNSGVKMVSPDLTKTRVELEHGRAAIEVDEIHPQNDLEVVDAGVTTQLVKPGFYEFDANQPAAMVFKGKAVVEVADGKFKELKDHHEFALAQTANGEPMAREKARSFNTDNAEDDLYNWSSLRSQYLAEGNNEIAGEYAYAPNFSPGWYWDPYMWDYTFIGMGPYWSPFGFGFYPPWYGFYGGGWYGGGWYGGRYHGPIGRGPGRPGSGRGMRLSGGMRGGFGGGFGGGHAGGGGHR
jgi:hypothetical protein